MSIPIGLQTHLEAALAALQSHPESDLLPIHRQALYQFFDSQSNRIGRAARTHLAIQATERVIHIYAMMPDDSGYPTMPRLMLESAQEFLTQLLAGTPVEQLKELEQTREVVVIFGTEDDVIERYTHTTKELLALAIEMHSLTGELASSLYYHAWCAFLSAMSTLLEALGHDSLAGATIDPKTSNWVLQCWGDAARWAAVAYAGGTFTEDDQPEPIDVVPHGTWDYTGLKVHVRRKEFWEWWLTEAIPSTWEIIKPLTTEK